MNKKILLLLLALCLAVGLCACAGGDNTNATTQPNNNQTETTAPNDETTGPAYTGPVYKVYVKDEQGNPISGAMVQLCQGSDCKPKSTDANGLAEYAVEEANYEVKFVRMPNGYTYSTSQEVFTFDNGSYELTIVLKAA